MLGMGWWGEERVISGAIKLQMSDDVLERLPPITSHCCTHKGLSYTSANTRPSWVHWIHSQKLHRVSSPLTLPLSSPLCFKLKVITLNVIHTVYFKYILKTNRLFN